MEEPGDQALGVVGPMLPGLSGFRILFLVVVDQPEPMETVKDAVLFGAQIEYCHDSFPFFC
jgi:hypothetical protein